MNLILIVLCGILMGAFNLGFFILGYYLGSKKEDDNAVEVNETNAKAIQELMRWMNYGGK